MIYSYEDKKKLIAEFKRKNLKYLSLIMLPIIILLVPCFIFIFNGEIMLGYILLIFVGILGSIFGTIVDKKIDIFLKENGFTRKEFTRMIKDNLSMPKINMQDNILDFNPNYKIGNVLSFDDYSRKFAICTGRLNPSIKKIIKYDDLIDVNIIQDNEPIIFNNLATSKLGEEGSITNAIIGKNDKTYCENLSIKLTINNDFNHCEFIKLISLKVRTNTHIYKDMCDIAKKAVNKFKDILIQKKYNPSINYKENFIDEKEIPTIIKQYKELFDNGLITEEEYNEKKKQLLKI